MPSERDKAKRWWQFSLRFMLLAVTTFSLGFILLAHWMDLQRREVAMQSARDFVNQELMLRHWISLETSAVMRQPIVQMGKDFSGLAAQPWSFDVVDTTDGTQYLTLSKPAQSLDYFEKKALQKIQAGATEVGRATWDGEVRYVQAINAKKSCVMCHSKFSPAASPLTGQIAVVSVRRPPK